MRTRGCNPPGKSGSPQSANAAMPRGAALGWLRWAQISILLLLVGPGSVVAQTWLPEKGTATTSVVFNDVWVREHWQSDGSRFDAGHTRAQSWGLLATYSLTDRLMLSAGVPYVRTEYHGLPSHGGDPHADEDDSKWHSDFTDFRIGVHYTLLRHPFVLTPLIAYSVPTHDYHTFGHAAHGNHVKEFWLGSGIGMNLSPWIPRTFVQARYTYAFLEHVQHVNHDRVNLNLELGTFFTRNWNVSAYGSWQDTRGGISLPIPRSNRYYLNHDRIGNNDFFNAGLGTTYSITSDWTLFATYMHGMSGRNGHVLAQGTTIGLSFGFNPRRASGAADF